MFNFCDQFLSSRAIFVAILILQIAMQINAVNYCEGFKCEKYCDDIKCLPKSHCSVYYKKINYKFIAKSFCECSEGHTYDSILGCIGPCLNITCGINAVCKAEGNVTKCECLPGFKGDPQVECRDLCENINCNQNEKCQVKNNEPACVCDVGYFGNPPKIKCVNETTDLCYLNPCGIEAYCKESFVESFYGCIDDLNCSVYTIYKGKCECDYNFIGDPYKECYEPCKYVKCGVNADCYSDDGEAQCRCEYGFFGNPQIECINKCQDVECGENAYCSKDNDKAECKCKSGYKFDTNKICRSCEDLKCGENAECKLNWNDEPNCGCPSGFVGDPLTKCTHKCDDIDCGENGVCKIEESEAKCECFHGYYSPSPNIKCKPFNESTDFCNPNPCGPESVCEYKKVQNVLKVNCACQKGKNRSNKPPNCQGSCDNSNDCDYQQYCNGDSYCEDPCKDNPCGNHSICRSEGHLTEAHCSCIDGFSPKVRVGCVKNSTQVPPEIIQKIKQIFPSKCSEKCKENAHCDFSSKKCICTQGFIGNPNKECELNLVANSSDPCTPHPCKPYETCKVVDNSTLCECPTEFNLKNNECGRCDSFLYPCNNGNICVAGKCVKNPCTEVCGAGALCEIHNDKVECFCGERNPHGNPYKQCYQDGGSSMSPLQCLASVHDKCGITLFTIRNPGPQKIRTSCPKCKCEDQKLQKFIDLT